MKRHLVDAIVPQVRHEVMKMNRLTIAILIGMVLGIFVGHMVRTLASDPASVESFANNITLLTDIFLRLIKMIIAPLVCKRP